LAAAIVVKLLAEPYENALGRTVWPLPLTVRHTQLLQSIKLTLTVRTNMEMISDTFFICFIPFNIPLFKNQVKFVQGKFH